MTPESRTLEQWGIGINPIAPVEPSQKFTFVKKDCDWSEAVELAIQCRKTHPDEAIELWPIEGAHRVHVVREKVTTA